ncbi:MAG: GMC family oxidoreductase N-terminal domain-containing protein [Burkholderiales bacterium]|nr:GMC family oxidoreductase N-terminal domain-containing protein [Burkholderiales bacterium]
MYDYLILGGGSASCVLAAQLTEDAGQTVCLVEADRDLTPLSMPDDIRSRYPGRAYLDTRNIWRHLRARLSDPSVDRPIDEHHEQAIVRYSSGLAGTPAGDMHGAILSRSGETDGDGSKPTA